MKQHAFTNLNIVQVFWAWIELEWVNWAFSELTFPNTQIWVWWWGWHLNLMNLLSDDKPGEFSANQNSQQVLFKAQKLLESSECSCLVELRIESSCRTDFSDGTWWTWWTSLLTFQVWWTWHLNLMNFSSYFFSLENLLFRCDELQNFFRELDEQFGWAWVISDGRAWVIFLMLRTIAFLSLDSPNYLSCRNIRIRTKIHKISPVNSSFSIEQQWKNARVCKSILEEKEEHRTVQISPREKRRKLVSANL